MLEVSVHHSVGETFPANTDTFKYTVTGELVHYQVGINETWSLHFVGNDTTNKWGVSCAKCAHQIVQLFLKIGKHIN